MARFTVMGTLQGEERSITWDDGKLSGDPLILTVLAIQAKVMEGKPVGNVAHQSYTNHLSDPLSVLCLLYDSVFERHPAPAPVLRGDVPSLPPLPSGAIA